MAAQHFWIWNNALCTEKIIVEKSAHSEKHHMYQWKHLIPNVKHGGGRMMVWVCCAATAPGHFVVTESTVNSCQSILESNVRPSVMQPKLGWNWVMQWDNDPSTRKQTRHCNGLVNLTEMLWWNLKKLCINGCSQNLNELKQRCEWAKIPPQRQKTNSVIQKTITSSYRS